MEEKNMTEESKVLAKTCPLCKAHYPEADKFCPDDGTPLQITDVSAPLLAKPEAEICSG